MGVLVKASVRNLRTSAQKLNLVAAMIRKMKVSDALVQLAFCMPTWTNLPERPLTQFGHIVRTCIGI